MTTGEPGSLLLRDVEVDGAIVDVRVAGGTVAAMEPAGSVDTRAGRVIDAGGGALLPGLHDHHLHLLAMAAAADSIDVQGGDLDRAIRTAHRVRPPADWLRVVGYDETVEGRLDRDRLDVLAPGRPVRVQHRSGALWVLSSAAIDALGITTDAPDGVEWADRRPTGRLFRLDEWIGARLPRTRPPDLGRVGQVLLARGVTGVTDTTPTTDPADFELIAGAVTRGELPLTVVVTGGPGLASVPPPHPLLEGPVKVVIADQALPDLDDLEQWFHTAHRAGRSVAVHCVTDVALALALAAWDAVGARAGDRVEHGSIIRPEHVERLMQHGLTVVTQPAFVHQSGDRYLAEVDGADVPHLYPCATLLDAGVPVGGSTDAPFGPDDPWLAVATAADRRTRSGRALVPEEAVTPRRALDLFLSELTDPGGPPRSLAVGSRADLCLLARPLADTLDDPRSAQVAATIVAGAVAFERA